MRNIEELFGHRGFTFVEHDVSEYVWVPGAVDTVMHFASPASPVDFERIPIQILKVGGLGTHNCLGLAKAKEHALTGRPLTGREAADCGLVNDAVPFGELEATVAALAADLADRCAEVVAVDSSATAVAAAQDRLADLSHVRAEHCDVPTQWPPGAFDLVVVSEVGYFLSPRDLERLVWTLDVRPE